MIKNRIRIVIHESYYQHWAGAQRTGVYLAAGLDKDRFDPVLVTTGEGMLANRARHLGVRVRIHVPPFPLNEFGRTLFNRNAWEKVWIACRKVLPYNLAFRRFLLQEKTDLLVCNTARSTLLLPFIKLMRTCPVVTYLQGAIELGEVIKRTVRLASDYFVTVSDEIANVYRLREEEYQIVPNGIPPDFTSGFIPQPPIAKARGRKWLVAVGNVVPYKGHHELLEAFACLSKRDSNWDLLIVGSTTENSEWAGYLKRESKRIGISSRVYWTGWVDDVRPFLSLADLFAMPSHVEGCPYCLMEAMAFGLPFVATDVSGVKILLGMDGDGIVVPPKDKVALAEGLMAAINRMRSTPSFGEKNATRIRSHLSRTAMCEKASQALFSFLRRRNTL